MERTDNNAASKRTHIADVVDGANIPFLCALQPTHVIANFLWAPKSQTMTKRHEPCRKGPNSRHLSSSLSDSRPSMATPSSGHTYEITLRWAAEVGFDRGRDLRLDLRIALSGLLQQPEFIYRTQLAPITRSTG